MIVDAAAAKEIFREQRREEVVLELRIASFKTVCEVRRSVLPAQESIKTGEISVPWR